MSLRNVRIRLSTVAKRFGMPRAKADRTIEGESVDHMATPPDLSSPRVLDLRDTSIKLQMRRMDRGSRSANRKIITIKQKPTIP